MCYTNGRAHIRLESLTDVDGSAVGNQPTLLEYRAYRVDLDADHSLRSVIAYPCTPAFCLFKSNQVHS